ncbi:caspase family protein [Acinetobacter sp. SA01]|uniref:caspase family protein n=1 Tax=Acinetobacter sp. SA01 TaxID=1862567 RepID=UPI00140E1B14|nr:caspase family protein [Acinetobacter sp. SA01]
MKNLAILIGVADYQHLNKLHPCSRDIDLISSILSTSSKYEDILLLNDSPKSNEAKDKISEFIRKHQDSEINEMFIYYTGHGARANNDFIYLFSDYHPQRQEQTSLRNSEFDSMIKSMKPTLTVKVVDACQAGTEYIKADSELQMIFEKSSTESFNKAYFLFSSSSAEYSTALPDFSVFTKSFAKSILSFDGKKIRFRDVMAYISDDQSVKKYQTPLFIQQADNTEIFLELTDELTDLIYSQIDIFENQNSDNKLLEDNVDQISEANNEILSPETLLINKIKEKSKHFCNEEEAQQVISSFGDKITETSWGTFINAVYSIDHKFENETLRLNSAKDLAKWIFKNDENYFTEIIYADEPYEVQKKVEYEESSAYASIFGRKRVEYQPVTQYRQVINSYRLTAPCPFQSIIFSLDPNEEILPWFKVYVTLIFSKSKLTLFYKYEIQKEINWSVRSVEEVNEWKTVHCNLKNIIEVENSANYILEDIIQLITQNIYNLIE